MTKFNETEWETIRKLFAEDANFVHAAMVGAREHIEDSDLGFYRDILDNPEKRCAADIAEARDYMAVYTRLCEVIRVLDANPARRTRQKVRTTVEEVNHAD